ncbi:hypothetical protein BA096_01415 [Salmonella enterica]|jgi:hypothetical protein|nr:hypothetical protein [Salmonella enterica]
MIQNKIANALKFARAHGHTQHAKILAIVEGEMRDLAKRKLTAERDPVLHDGEANEILKRHLRHAGITLQMNPNDPTAELVIDILSDFHVDDVMSDAEIRDRIKASGLREPRKILKHLNSFGGAVDMSRARTIVRTVYGD